MEGLAQPTSLEEMMRNKISNSRKLNLGQKKCQLPRERVKNLNKTNIAKNCSSVNTSMISTVTTINLPGQSLKSAQEHV